MKSIIKLIAIAIMFSASSLQFVALGNDYNIESYIHESQRKIDYSFSNTQSESFNLGLFLYFINVEDDTKFDSLIIDFPDFRRYKILIFSFLNHEDQQHKKLQNPLLLVEFKPLKFYDVYCDWQIDYC